MGWNYLSFPKLPKWIINIIPHFTQSCDYLSMLGIKLTDVNKRGPWNQNDAAYHETFHARHIIPHWYVYVDSLLTWYIEARWRIYASVHTCICLNGQGSHRHCHSRYTLASCSFCQDQMYASILDTMFLLMYLWCWSCDSIATPQQETNLIYFLSFR